MGATAMVNRGAQQVLIGWSSEVLANKRSWDQEPDDCGCNSDGLLRQWTINPKDKLRARPWRFHDRVVVIKLVPDAGEDPVTDEQRMVRRRTITSTTERKARASRTESGLGELKDSVTKMFSMKRNTVA